MIASPVRYELPNNRKAISIAVSASNKYIVVGCTDGSIVISDDETGENLQTLPIHEAPVSAVAFCNKEFGMVIATGSFDHTINILCCYNINEWVKLHVTKPLSGAITCLEFCKCYNSPPSSYVLSSLLPTSPIGLFLAAGCSNGILYILSLCANHAWMERSFLAHNSNINCLVWANSVISLCSTDSPINYNYPETACIITAGYDGLINIWKPTESGNFEKLNTLLGHYRSVISLALTDDCTKLASLSDDGTIIIWNLVNGNYVQDKILRKIVPESQSITWHYDNSAIYASHNEKAPIKLVVDNMFEQ